MDCGFGLQWLPLLLLFIWICLGQFFFLESNVFLKNSSYNYLSRNKSHVAGDMYGSLEPDRGSRAWSRLAHWSGSSDAWARINSRDISARCCWRGFVHRTLVSFCITCVTVFSIPGYLVVSLV
jgi:hypothetical protein